MYVLPVKGQLLLGPIDGLREITGLRLTDQKAMQKFCCHVWKFFSTEVGKLYKIEA